MIRKTKIFLRFSQLLSNNFFDKLFFCKWQTTIKCNVTVIVQNSITIGNKTFFSKTNKFIFIKREYSKHRTSSLTLIINRQLLAERKMLPTTIVVVTRPADLPHNL